MKEQFLLCGSIGWGMEILWTGFHALCRKDFKLVGQSSLWMFPIYGCAAFIGPVSRKLSGLPAILRGSIYTVGIFATEYSTGRLLDYFQNLSLGLQQMPFELSQCHTSGLCSHLVFHRTFLRENTCG